MAQQNDSYLGLNLDDRPTGMSTGFYAYAKNILVGDVNNCITNEPGFNKYYSSKINDYIIIGVIETDSVHIMFGVSKLYGYSQIFLFDPTAVAPTDCLTLLLLDEPAYSFLNFNEQYYITGEYQRDFKGNLVIVFTDKFNSVKYINIQDLQDDPNKYKDFNQWALIPEYDTPQTQLSLVQGGGALLPGTYQFCLQYQNADGATTAYTQVTDGIVLRPSTTNDFVSNYYLQVNINGLDQNYDFYNPIIIANNNNTITIKQLPSIPIIADTTTFVFLGNENNFTTPTTAQILQQLLFINKVNTITQLNNRLFMGGVSYDNDYRNMQKYANLITLQWTSTLVDLNTGAPGTTIGIANNDTMVRNLSTGQMKGLMHDEVYAFYIRYKLKNGNYTQAFHIPNFNPIASDTSIGTRYLSRANTAVSYNQPSDIGGYGGLGTKARRCDVEFFEPNINGTTISTQNTYIYNTKENYDIYATYTTFLNIPYYFRSLNAIGYGNYLFGLYSNNNNSDLYPDDDYYDSSNLYASIDDIIYNIRSKDGSFLGINDAALRLKAVNYRGQNVFHHKTPSHSMMRTMFYNDYNKYISFNPTTSISNGFDNGKVYGYTALDVLGVRAFNVIIPPEYANYIEGYEICYAERTIQNTSNYGMGMTLNNGVMSYSPSNYSIARAQRFNPPSNTGTNFFGLYGSTDVNDGGITSDQPRLPGGGLYTDSSGAVINLGNRWDNGYNGQTKKNTKGGLNYDNGIFDINLLGDSQAKPKLLLFSIGHNGSTFSSFGTGAGSVTEFLQLTFNTYLQNGIPSDSGTLMYTPLQQSFRFYNFDMLFNTPQITPQYFALQFRMRMEKSIYQGGNNLWAGAAFKKNGWSTYTGNSGQEGGTTFTLESFSIFDFTWITDNNSFIQQDDRFNQLGKYSVNNIVSQELQSDSDFAYSNEKNNNWYSRYQRHHINAIRYSQYLPANTISNNFTSYRAEASYVGTTFGKVNDFVNNFDISDFKADAGNVDRYSGSSFRGPSPFYGQETPSPPSPAGNQPKQFDSINGGTEYWLQYLKAISINQYYPFTQQNIITTNVLNTSVNVLQDQSLLFKSTLPINKGDVYIGYTIFMTNGYNNIVTTGPKNIGNAALIFSKFCYRYIGETTSNTYARGINSDIYSRYPFYDPNINNYNNDLPGSVGTTPGSFPYSLDPVFDPNAQIQYNKLYNNQNKFVVIPPANLGLDQSFLYPYRIHFSTQLSTQTGATAQSWRNWFALDYYEMIKDKGVVVRLQGINERLLIHCKNALFVTQDKLRLTPQTNSNLKSITLYQGDLLNSQFEPLEILPTALGYGGLSYDTHAKKCTIGYVFVDINMGMVFIYNPADNSLNSINNYLNRFLRQQLTSYTANNNPFLSTSNRIVIGYDNLYKRILLSYYVAGGNSFTLSFNTDVKNWVAFHDYVPNYYINDRNYLMNIYDNGQYAIYLMNSVNQGTNYNFGRFYQNLPNPSFIDLVFTSKIKVSAQYKADPDGINIRNTKNDFDSANAIKTFILNYISWVSEVIQLGDTLDNSNAILAFETFDSIAAWNDNKHTGEININLSDIDQFLESNCRKTSGQFLFNSFRNTLLDTASYGGKFLDSIFNDYNLNTSVVGQTASWYEQDNIEGNYIIIRLKYNNDNKNKQILLYQSRVDISISDR